MRVRIGLHTGEAGRSDEGYVGFAVHKAARIGDLGHGGQILLSATTAALVEHELPEGVRLRDLGEAALDRARAPERLFQLDDRGPAVGVPAPRRAPRAAPAPGAACCSSARGSSPPSPRYVHAALGRQRAPRRDRGPRRARQDAPAHGGAVGRGRGRAGRPRGARRRARGRASRTASCGSSSSRRSPRPRPDGRTELLSGAAALASALFDERRLAEALAGGAADTRSRPCTASSGSRPISRRAARCCSRSTTCTGATRPSLRWLLYLRAGSRACRCSSSPRRARRSRRPRSSC